MKRECPEIVKCMNEHDIVFFSETWTNMNSCIDVDDFVVFSKHRRRKKCARRDSGGLVCYFRKQVAGGVSEIEWQYEDGMCFKLDKDFFGWEDDVFMLCVYMRASNSTREDMAEGLNCYDIVTEKLASVCNLGNVLILGDMNARIGDKCECLIETEEDCREREREESMMRTGLPESDRVFCEDDFLRNKMLVTRTNEDTTCNEYGNRLIQMTYAADLAILNGRCLDSDKNLGGFTFSNHRGKSAIDYVMCDKFMLDKIVNFSVLEENEISDHCMLVFDICTGHVVRENESQNGRERVYAKWREDKKYDYVLNIESYEVERELENLGRQLIDNAEVEVLEHGIKKLGDLLTKAGSGHINKVGGQGRGDSKKEGGNGRKRGEGGAWYDGDCQRQKDIFLEGQRRYRELDTEEARVWMNTQRNIYRKICRSKRREYLGQEAERLSELSRTNPNAFWREVKGKKKRAGLPDLDFFEHFKNLANKESSVGEAGQVEIESANEGQEEIHIDIVDNAIGMSELEGAIKSLKKDKSAGEDLILNDFILNASHTVKILILIIFNNILTLEYFPSVWTVGSIVPIFKSGDKNNLNNYRGITILSCLGKLFTKILNRRLTAWAEQHNILDETQYGFRKHRSTVDCIFIIHGLIELLLAQGKKLYCCFIDYEKAFDYLDRAAMWAKMIKMGSSSKCIRLLKNMYSKIKLGVRGDNEDRFFTSHLGLLQGESTSPILFSLFVNDLEGELANDTIGSRVQDIIIKLIKFADDMAVFSETREGLQTALDNLNQYCKKWGISVNIPKTKIVVFRKGGRLCANDKWQFNGTFLEVVSVFKYLGVWMGTTGSFSKCVAELTNSARRALFSLKSYF